MHYIYIIRNNVNGKLYVGQANNPKRRWVQHKSDAKNVPDKMVISRAINKYGAQNFTFAVIEEHPTLEEVNEAEDFWIEFLGTRKPDVGYNIRPGGNNTPMSPETKAKMSAARKGKMPWNKGIRTSISPRNKGIRTSILPWNKGIHTGISPWNKGTKGLTKANSGSFVATIDWPEDQVLLAMVNARGLGAVAREYKTDASSVNRRLQSRNLQHNRLVGYAPETQFKTGTEHPGAKLTPDQVLEIVALYNTGSYTQTELGRLFGVDRMNIKKIITGQTWSHLTGIKSE